MFPKGAWGEGWEREGWEDFSGNTLIKKIAHLFKVPKSSLPLPGCKNNYFL